MLKRKIFIVFGFLILAFLAFMLIFGDLGGFVSAIFRNPKSMGAATPSSSFLAKKITKNIMAKDAPLKILEVGAGTGVFTQEIINKIGQNDIVDVIEIDYGLCEILNKKFKNNKNVNIHCVSILDWEPGYKYDFIVSGLPFNAFDSFFVSNILEKFKNIIIDNGVLSYFEYALAGKTKKLFLFGDEKLDLINNIKMRKEFLKKFEFDRDLIFLNFPPAYVYHLKIVKNS
ncbi:MAG: hypothetical protein ACD_82C00040G0001 [uncultured bacterium]|nr:MAG: hypothetical protein ACD_82C00040G0001 [uncultured bacterium]KKP29912.1 MAG: hypothetical protein UR12_C0001G0047 [candidate division TM6 bacterium GW2011_GWF2_30_66]